jgi:transcriptional regulator with XRE-family HTH domain
VNYRAAATRVRKWRRLHEIDQIAFARQAKISVGCLQGFERAVRATRRANLVKIAKVLGMSVEQLLEDDRAPMPSVTLDELKRAAMEYLAKAFAGGESDVHVVHAAVAIIALSEA